MAKLKDMPVSVADIKEYLESEDSFQLEMSVYHECLQNKLQAEHGGTYTDPVTQKSRQFDIRAYAVNDHLAVRLAIECKSLKKSFPLLVSRVPRSVDESFYDVVASIDRSVGGIFEVSGRSLRLLDRDHMYPVGGMVGKVTAQIGRGLDGHIIASDGEVFDKWMQAVASAFELVGKSIEGWRNPPVKGLCTLILPILVVNDDSLWVVDYTKDGTMVGDPRPADECELYLKKEVNTGQCSELSLKGIVNPGAISSNRPIYNGLDYTFSHIHIFTRTAFSTWLRKLSSNQNYWSDIFPIGKLAELDPKFFAKINERY